MPFLWTLVILIVVVSEKVYGESVTQTEDPVTVQEGQNIFLSCKYETTGSPILFWYEQYPNNPPRLLLSSYDSQDAETNIRRRGFSHQHNKARNAGTFDLRKNLAELRDAAVYFCALRVYGGAANKLSFGQGTRLIVVPNLEPSLPSVYKLKPSSEEKQGKAACLFTDYSPNPLNVGINKEVTKEVNGSVVVVKEDKSEKGTASYGIVLWGDDTDSFHCHADAENPKGDSGTCLAEDGDITFETDERLNLLSFTVLGLRVIFLKTVSFNLLLTFRLWSR